MQRDTAVVVDEKHNACSSSSQLSDDTAAEAKPSWFDRKMFAVRKSVLNFTPAWFAMTMGTGITSIILNNLSFQFKGLHYIAAVIFAFNVFIFILFLSMSIARYSIWPQTWSLMLLHPVSSMMLGTFAMGFATLGNGVVTFCGHWGRNWVLLGWAIWWMESFVSVLVGVGVPFLLATRQKHDDSTMTAVWMLPVVSPNVSAAAGGIIAPYLLPGEARLTIICSYLWLGISLPPAVCLMAIYYKRLALYKGPPTALAISTFLPIGPCGQSAFALLQLAVAIRHLQQTTGAGISSNLPISALANEIVTESIYAGSLVSALLMMGFGFFWTILAFANTIDMWVQKKLSYNVGWWAFTFPLGTMATASTLFAREIDSTAFKVVAMIISLTEVGLWIFVMINTVVAVLKGTAFVAPELAPFGGQAPPRIQKIEKDASDKV